MKSALAAVVLVVMGTAAAMSCSSGKPTLTKEQAAARGEQHIKEMAELLPPGATIEFYRESGVPCGSTFGGNGQSSLERVYHVDGIPKDQYLAVMNRYWDFWRDGGYTLANDNRAHDALQSVSAFHPDDDFLLYVGVDIGGTLELAVDSTCLKDS